MKYRSRTDIIIQMLKVAANYNNAGHGSGATKTKIMFKSFISSGQLNQYLSFLLENKLLDYDKKTAQYKVTEKGLKFLNVMDELSLFIGSKTNEIELITTT